MATHNVSFNLATNPYANTIVEEFFKWQQRNLVSHHELAAISGISYPTFFRIKREKTISLMNLRKMEHFLAMNNRSLFKMWKNGKPKTTNGKAND